MTRRPGERKAPRAVRCEEERADMDENASDALKLENQLCFPLYAASRRVVGLYTPYLKDLGLTYTQYLVFLVLWDGDGITVGEVCRRLYLDSGTLTPLLKNLEKAGYVVRKRSKEDERVVLVSLTEEGKALKDRMGDIPRCVGDVLPISREDALTLYGLLYKLLEPAKGDSLSQL